jgi:DNA-binding response OmpR family regulator
MSALLPFQKALAMSGSSYTSGFGQAVSEDLSDERPRCLVVEDESVIATFLEEELRDAEISVIGPFTRCDEAIHRLQYISPHVAILDTQLLDGSSAQLALKLRARNIPFVVHSGYDRTHEQAIEAYAEAPWITKPSMPGDIVRAVKSLVEVKSCDDTGG